MRQHPPRHGAPMTKRSVRATLVALAVAGLLGACGNGGGSEELSAAEEAEFETASEFAQCMRDEGIEGLPDPQLKGDGFVMVGSPLDPRDAEDWQTAQEACQHVFDDAAEE
jgi:hypothetical protein